MPKKISAHIVVVKILLLLFATRVAAQGPGDAKFKAPDNLIWVNSYAKFHVSKKLYWDAQFHFRTQNSDNIPLLGQVAQIYNRHGLTYIPRPNIAITFGPVLRLDFTPEPGNSELKKVILEPRIWHEYLFSMPFPRMVLYHRIRIEHRWSTTHQKDADWIFRNRWRYFIMAMIPINKPKLVPGTYFFNPGVELIMQTGNPIGGSPVDDLRIIPQIGYIQSASIKYSAGLMWTTGQSLADAYVYRTRWVVRLNVYISLDFRKLEEKIPEIRIFD